MKYFLKTFVINHKIPGIRKWTISQYTYPIQIKNVPILLIYIDSGKFWTLLVPLNLTVLPPLLRIYLLYALNGIFQKRSYSIILIVRPSIRPSVLPSGRHEVGKRDYLSSYQRQTADLLSTFPSVWSIIKYNSSMAVRLLYSRFVAVLYFQRIDFLGSYLRQKAETLF